MYSKKYREQLADDYYGEFDLDKFSDVVYWFQYVLPFYLANALQTSFLVQDFNFVFHFSFGGAFFRLLQIAQFTYKLFAPAKRTLKQTITK